jgi:hypothetical protein
MIMSRGPARFAIQHQRGQPFGLGLLRQQRHQQRPQEQGLSGQFMGGGIGARGGIPACAVGRIHGLKHIGQPLGHVVTVCSISGVQLAGSIAGRQRAK